LTQGVRIICAHRVHLQGVRVMFVYEGHWARVKVTGAKKWTTFQYSRSGNLHASTNPDPRSVKIPLLITPRLCYTESGSLHKVCMQHRIFVYGRSNGVTAIFVT